MNMKSKLKTSKISKIILCMMMLFSQFIGNVSPVSAASYTLHEEFDSNWTYKAGKTGTPTRMWINSGSWNQAVANNNEVFCIDPTKTSVPGANNTILTPEQCGYSRELINKLALIAYYGYKTQKSTTNYFLTQNLIWETIGKKRPQDSGVQYVGNSQYPTRASQDAWQKKVMDKVNAFNKVPSFNNTIVTTSIGKQKVLSDTNKVLSGLQIKSVTGGSAKISGNNLIVTPSGTDNMKITFKREMTQAQTRTNFIVNKGGETQPVSNLCSGQDPYNAYVNVKVQYGYVQIRKTSTYDGKQVEGATYSLTNSKGNIVTYLTSSASGWTKSQALPLGTYTLKEVKVPNGYKLDTNSYQINLKVSGQVESKTVQNEPFGYIRIRKKDAEADDKGYHKLVGGAVYELRNSKGEVVETFTTKDENADKDKADSERGWVISKQLPLGNYTLKEKSVPDGYMLDTQSYQINLKIAGLVESKTVYDQQQGQWSVMKIDAETKQPLAGVEFAISEYADMSNIFGRKKTNEDGIATFSHLNQNSVYYVQEVAGIDGYITDNTIHKVWLGSSEANSTKLVVSNQPRKGSVQILKVDNEDKVLSDVEFVIAKDEAMKNIITSAKTNKDGVATFKDLRYGTYYIQEKQNKGYVTNDEIYKVIINDDSKPVEIRVVNEPIVATFLKIDATTKDAVEGAELALIDKESGEIIDTWTSSNEPHVIKNLDEDKTYIFREIKAPEGYELAKDIEVKVNSKQNHFKFEMEDVPYVDISKVDATTGKELAGAEMEVIDKESGESVDTWTSSDEPYKIKGLVTGKSYILKENLAPLGYEIANAIEFVAGSKVKIVMEDVPYVDISKVDATTGKEIVGAEMKVIDKESGKSVDTWTSSDEPHKIKGLVTGKTYILKENLAPLGYEIANAIEFVAGSKDKIVMEDVPYVNISKVDATTGKELPGAEMEVIDKESGKSVDTWTSSDEPHKIKGLVTGKTYILKENLAPLGYEIANAIEFVAGSKDKIVMEDVPYVDISKVDATTGKEIAGAEMEVIDKESGKSVDTWTSSDEPHKIKGLVTGKTYILKENLAPLGYEIANEIEFIVGSKDKIVMKDELIKVDLLVRKLDAGSKYVILNNDFEFTLYADEKCSKIIAKANGDKKSGIATFKDLNYGTYYLKETKAPLGYQLSNEVKKIEINQKTVNANKQLLVDYLNTSVPKTGVDKPFIQLSMGVIVFSMIILVISMKKNSEKQ